MRLRSLLRSALAVPPARFAAFDGIGRADELALAASR